MNGRTRVSQLDMHTQTPPPPPHHLRVHTHTRTLWQKDKGWISASFSPIPNRSQIDSGLFKSRLVVLLHSLALPAAPEIWLEQSGSFLWHLFFWINVIWMKFEEKRRKQNDGESLTKRPGGVFSWDGAGQATKVMRSKPGQQGSCLSTRIVTSQWITNIHVGVLAPCKGCRHGRWPLRIYWKNRKPPLINIDTVP